TSGMGLVLGGRARVVLTGHADASWAVRYAAHQLNLWPSDARPQVTSVSLWTGSPGVAADFRILGSLAHVRAPGANKLSPRTHACVFLGFPLDASGWVFYDPVTYEFFASQDVTFVKVSVTTESPPPRGCGRGGHSHGGHSSLESAASPRITPLLPVRVLHVTPQSSPPERLVSVVSGGGVGVEVTPMEDTAASSRRPRPASPLYFPSVPQFPPRSSLWSVAAELGGVPTGGTGDPRGVTGGGACSGGAGAGSTGTVPPTRRTVCFLTREQRLLRLEREERDLFERA
ncbi:unnamed protein product, partial [Closterium sp. NIES-54]